MYPCTLLWHCMPRLGFGKDTSSNRDVRSRLHSVVLFRSFVPKPRRFETREKRLPTSGGCWLCTLQANCWKPQADEKGNKMKQSTLNSKQKIRLQSSRSRSIKTCCLNGRQNMFWPIAGQDMSLIQCLACMTCQRCFFVLVYLFNLTTFCDALLACLTHSSFCMRGKTMSLVRVEKPVSEYTLYILTYSQNTDAACEAFTTCSMSVQFSEPQAQTQVFATGQTQP